MKQAPDFLSIATVLLGLKAQKNMNFRCLWYNFSKFQYTINESN